MHNEEKEEEEAEADVVHKERGTQQLRGPFLSFWWVRRCASCCIIINHFPSSSSSSYLVFLILVGSHIEKKKKKKLFCILRRRKSFVVQGKRKGTRRGSSGSWNNLFQGEKNNTLAIHYRSSSFSFFLYLGASMRGCRVNRLSVFRLLLLGHVEFLLHPPVYVCARRPKGGGTLSRIHSWYFTCSCMTTWKSETK